jgi:hypothetical protein
VTRTLIWDGLENVRDLAGRRPALSADREEEHASVRGYLLAARTQAASLDRLRARLRA